ncbi:GLPGLI family protein [Chitinophaga arvensicola]|uniref:GLPGLI family protein n=1 Tax=Chitinophaga arvensicola TaxID=29529 RepID=A0A1I0SCB2_9BACT|nr:GLPGLI family protein [Chitinophaga arvensicola]SEW53411.1 GLPGLI family protein [Chitinophaga arvensicola]
MKSICIILSVFVIVILSVFPAKAQHTVFLQQGRIEYEKRVNAFARMDELNKGEENSWTEMIKKGMSQYQVTYFDYAFTNSTTLYKPGRDNPDNKVIPWQDAPAEKNIVYSRLDSMQSIAQKQVFEQNYLVKDTMRQIRWKITDETRKIAGFDCRRANAVIMDSIYVVAFYTDAIVTPGGPESFSGLPGMILGVALPHEHITWFATKVLVDDVKPETLKPPVKGKPVDNKGIRESITKVLGKWGRYGNSYIKSIML